MEEVATGEGVGAVDRIYATEVNGNAAKSPVAEAMESRNKMIHDAWEKIGALRS